MMDPPPELAAAVIAVSAHDNHWVAHGAGAFSLEQMLGLFDGFDHPDVGLVGGILRLVTAGRRLRPGFEDLPLVRAQDTVLAGSRMPYREWLTTPDAQAPPVATDAARSGARAGQRPCLIAGRLARSVR
jgi:hypothetical protein